MSHSISQELVTRGRELLREGGLDAVTFEACRVRGKPISNGSARHAMPGGRRDLLLALYIEVANELRQVARSAVGPHPSHFEAAAGALARALADYARRRPREVRCFTELRQRFRMDGSAEQRAQAEESLSDWSTSFRKEGSVDPNLNQALVPALVLLPLMIGLESGGEDVGALASEVSQRLAHGSAAQTPRRRIAAPAPKRADLFA